jgi:hypothetical protein
MWSHHWSTLRCNTIFGNKLNSATRQIRWGKHPCESVNDNSMDGDTVRLGTNGRSVPKTLVAQKQVHVLDVFLLARHRHPFAVRRALSHVAACH